MRGVFGAYLFNLEDVLHCFPRTKVDSGQALSPTQMVLLTVGQEECPERCGGLCLYCLHLSVGSVSLNPDT